MTPAEALHVFSCSTSISCEWCGCVSDYGSELCARCFPEFDLVSTVLLRMREGQGDVHVEPSDCREFIEKTGIA